jgi:hypothetical protein
LTANGRQIVGFNPPTILYFTANESIVVSAGRISYSLVGDYSQCYTTSDTSCQSHVRYYGDWYCVTTHICIRQYTEWGRTYKLQAIELVDWDTGEVYASVNQTSLTFNINANMIVRFKYVLVDSWSRSWQVILQPPTPEPTPDECQQILNDPNKRCTGAWCSCLKTYDPEAWNKEECCRTRRLICLSVHVTPCCTGDAYDACLNSWSGQGGTGCISCRDDSECTSKLPVTVSWSASWSLKPGWALAGIGKTGYGGGVGCGVSSLTGSSASGSCTLNAIDHAVQWVVVIFKRT